MFPAQACMFGTAVQVLPCCCFMDIREPTPPGIEWRRCWRVITRSSARIFEDWSILEAEGFPDHAGSSKRAKAGDCVALMRRLGFDRFALVGHDRGSYTAFRTAMDYPSAITQLVILDGVPIVEALERCTARFATAWWHWFFFAQPEKPERAILADPDAWYGGSPNEMGAEAYEDFRAAIHDPATIHGMVEDYRAGLGIDRRHDEESRAAGQLISCPTMVLWSLKDDLVQLYGDVLDVWRSWTMELCGRGIDCGHHMAEEAPEELATEISGLSRGRLVGH